MRPEHWHNFGYVFTCYLTTTGFPKQEISFCFIDQMSYFCNIGEFFLFSILPFLHPFPFLYLFLHLAFLHPWTSCWSIIQTLRGLLRDKALVAFRRISLGSPTFLPIFRCLSPSHFVPQVGIFLSFFPPPILCILTPLDSVKKHGKESVDDYRLAPQLRFLGMHVSSHVAMKVWSKLGILLPITFYSTFLYLLPLYQTRKHLWISSFPRSVHHLGLGLQAVISFNRGFVT